MVTDRVKGAAKSILGKFRETVGMAAGTDKSQAKGAQHRAASTQAKSTPRKTAGTQAKSTPHRAAGKSQRTSGRAKTVKK